MNGLSFSAVKSQWSSLLQFAVWVGTVIAMFLTQPPVLTLSGSPGVSPLRFAQFLFAVLTAIALQVFTRKTLRSRRIRMKWEAGCAACAVVLFFGYMAVLNSWTCAYAVHWQVVKSTGYTEDARATAERLPGKGNDCAEVLEEYGGKAELVWEQSETRLRYLAIQALYMALWLSSACALVLAVQGNPASASMARNGRTSERRT